MSDFEVQKRGAGKKLDPGLYVPIEVAQQMKKLLEVARCPNDGCVDGGIPVQVGDNDWEQQQCQWCYERSQI